MSIHPSVMASTPDRELLFSPKEETKESIAMVGTMRALAINMIKGVSDGFEKKLEILKFYIWGPGPENFEFLSFSLFFYIDPTFSILKNTGYTMRQVPEL